MLQYVGKTFTKEHFLAEKALKFDHSTSTASLFMVRRNIEITFNISVYRDQFNIFLSKWIFYWNILIFSCWNQKSNIVLCHCTYMRETSKAMCIVNTCVRFTLCIYFLVGNIHNIHDWVPSTLTKHYWLLTRCPCISKGCFGPLTVAHFLFAAPTKPFKIIIYQRQQLYYFLTGVINWNIQN